MAQLISKHFGDVLDDLVAEASLVPEDDVDEGNASGS